MPPASLPGWARWVVALALLAAAAPAAGRAAAGREQKGDGNPLAGLPALPKVHHSFGMCRPGSGSGAMPWVGCALPVDSGSALQRDFARITHAWAIDVAFDAGGHPEHTAAGEPIWDDAVVAKSENKTEVLEAVKLCALANASLSINYSPWAYIWGSSSLYCPTGPTNCDPTIRGVGEELELRFFRTRLQHITAWVAEANARLGSAVKIGAVLLDSERFYINTKNETQMAALTRKDDLIYNVSREFCDPGTGCTVEQYNRGTINQEKTLAKPAEGIPADDAWTPWPGYPSCRGLGDSFATSLYTIPEYEATRESYRRTVANAEACNISFVTPWLWLGGGERRAVNERHDADTRGDMLWDYDEAYSWMLGKEIADPFYSQHPARFAPWQSARVVALFPNPLDSLAWARPPSVVNETTGAVEGGDVLSSVTLKHFVAYVKGAAGIRINTTLGPEAQRLGRKTDDVMPSFPPHLVGNATAVAALLERVLPGSSAQFMLSIEPSCPGIPAGKACFSLSDGPAGKTKITGTSASELTGGLGVYLREHCGMTVGWERGGGSHVFTPKPWPKVGAPLSRARSVPWSHVTQVCTHSYTLVWHDWGQWEQFIDWMALAGHNSIVAPTGQEEVQYKVLTEHFGVSDMGVRNWTNGPAWLTWSRGQNSHGNGVGGPLPRSFMRGQWSLQRRILARYRELGIAGHLPAFGGWAPWELTVAQNATGIAQGKGAASDTAWIDGRDPLYTAVADRWMAQIIEDFGSDHVWQMDGFFANGSSWGLELTDEAAAPVPCEWSAAKNNTYLAGYTSKGPMSFPTLEEAKAACIDPGTIETCGGVVSRRHGAGFDVRGGTKPLPVPASDAEASYLLLNRKQCSPVPDTPPSTEIWRNRSAAAYGAVARADGPTARWVYQGYALGIASGGLGPAGDPYAIDRLHSFTAPIPQGQFILLDMSAHGQPGEWRQWKGKWKLPFIWTSLHTYGGNMGIKGNLSAINGIPFQAPPLAPVPDKYDPKTEAVGVGYTPEGLDQNTAYYELLQEAAFKAAPEPNITDWLVRRAHRRYGLLGGHNADVAGAWAALGASGYAIDKGVGDASGVCQMGTLDEISRGLDKTYFESDLRTPTAEMCLEWAAWGSLNAAAPAVAAATAGGGEGLPEPFVYDLVNTAREALAQLSTPMLLNFSSSFNSSAARIDETATLFTELLRDLERLLATDPAFMLGPWLASARRLAGNATDCIDTQIAGDIGDCADFMEWNARAQLTTWYPVIGSASAPIVQQNGRDHDYARKQWSGLIRDVFIPRTELYRKQALSDAAAGSAFNGTAALESYARLSFAWQTSYPSKYPTQPQGDPVTVSAELWRKYSSFFSSCG